MYVVVAARPVDFAYTDNGGRLIIARQPSRDDASGFLTPTVVSGQLALTGRPQLAEDATGTTLNAFGLVQNGQVWRGTRTGTASAFTLANDLGNLSAPPTVLRLTDKSLLQLGVDTEGKLWAKKQYGTSATYFPWRRLTEPAGQSLVGPVTARPLTPSITSVVARDRTGTIWYTTLTDFGSIGTWVNLGGTGSINLPTMVIAPGPKVRVIARAKTGAIITKAQTATNGPFPAAWQTITPSGTPATTGNPAAIINPTDNKVTVFARGTDGSIYATQENGNTCGTFGPWWATLTSGPGAVFAADPTAYAVDVGGQTQWGIATLSNDEALTIQYRKDSIGIPATPPTCAGTARVAGATPSPPARPTFTTRTFPIVK